MKDSETADTRARALRRNMTEAEKHLWSALRLRRLDNHRFRRQQPIGNYIVDFICIEARLIIELDGSQHAEEEQAWYDKRRSDWLSSQGFCVIRFWNGDVLKRRSHVIDAIRFALGAPHPSRRSAPIHLPPQGGKGEQ